MTISYFNDGSGEEYGPLKMGDLVQLVPTENKAGTFYEYPYQTVVNVGVVLTSSIHSISLGIECYDVQWLDTNKVQVVDREELWLLAPAIKAT